MPDELGRRIAAIARVLLGEPNKRLSSPNQLRFGSHGSIAVEILGRKAGTWYDHEDGVGGSAIDLIRLKGGIPDERIPAWIKGNLGIVERPPAATKRAIAAVYSYRRDDGATAYQVVRFAPKEFRQRRPDPNKPGGWIWNLKGVRPLPYRLPELSASPPGDRIYIVEGEKDADRLAELGAAVTTNSGGATKWPAGLAGYFTGRRVVILPDNDAAGHAHAEAIKAALVGAAAEVHILALPGLPDKGDVSDWLDAGGTLLQLDELADACGAAALCDQSLPNDSPCVIDPRAPFDIARIFVERHFTVTALPTLRRHRAQFFRWTGVFYADAPEEDLSARLYHFLDQCQLRARQGFAPVKPNPKLVSDTLHALRHAVLLPSDLRAPVWLDDVADLAPEDIIACENGLLHLPTRELLPLSPAFFTHNGLDFAYQRGAPEPAEWLRFLEQLWPDDLESIKTLQEYTGYCLSPDTSQQKALLMIGPKRSGKGTINRVLTALVGAENTVNPKIADLGSNFGLAPLIGKQLALISDARLGSRADHDAVAEALLSIIGEDFKTLDRKYLSAWTGRLRVRFVIFSNELPRLLDASGALASRFILLRMAQSFYGREDLGLLRRLLAELPGILNWAIAGWARLKERGHFIQPVSAAEVVEQLQDLGSPVNAFFRECCESAPVRSVPVNEAFDAWRGWCHENGRARVGTAQTFGRDLRAAVPGVHVIRLRSGDERSRAYAGFGLSAIGLEMMKLVRAGPRS